jgi:NAD(P)-dependent dehydrogenase (short-subunit alcohol dehydrogenase family)
MSTILVTGSNRGIGLELCRLLSTRGDEIIATCRIASPGLESLGTRIIEDVDVSDDGSVRALVEQLEGVHLDVLINNAGILTRDNLDDLDLDKIRRQFEINALGPLRITKALLGNLGRGSKVAVITSLMGSLADNSSGSYYGYRISKAAVNMVAVNLAQDLHGRGIPVVILHPGMVATDMTGGRGIPPAEAARGLIARIDALELDKTGSFWHANGQSLPW